MTTRSASNKRGASKSPQKKKKNIPGKKMPRGMMLVAGVAMGFFGAFLIGLIPNAMDVRTAAEQGAQKEREIINRPVFDFYTLLPESEVTVSSFEQNSQRQAVERVEARPTAKSGDKTLGLSAASKQYLLQVGSFRNQSDASRLRAELVLQGLEPRVEEVSVRNGEIWFRVQLGPFSDSEALSKTRIVLAEKRIDSLLLQLK